MYFEYNKAKFGEINNFKVFKKYIRCLTDLP